MDWEDLRKRLEAICQETGQEFKIEEDEYGADRVFIGNIGSGGDYYMSEKGMPRLLRAGMLAVTAYLEKAPGFLKVQADQIEEKERRLAAYKRHHEQCKRAVELLQVLERHCQ